MISSFAQSRRSSLAKRSSSSRLAHVSPPRSDEPWSIALFGVRLASSLNLGDGAESRIPTTIRSRIISSFTAPYSQYSARQKSAVIKLSTNSPSSWHRLLNLALSKIALRRMTKWLVKISLDYHILVSFFNR